MTDAVAPMVLWDQADREYPRDPIARRARYLELMRMVGHVVAREEGDDRPLFPCGYDPKAKPYLCGGCNVRGVHEHRCFGDDAAWMGDPCCECPEPMCRDRQRR